MNWTASKIMAFGGGEVRLGRRGREILAVLIVCVCVCVCER